MPGIIVIMVPHDSMKSRNTGAQAAVQLVGPPVERGLSVKVREAAGVPKAE